MPSAHSQPRRQLSAPIPCMTSSPGKKTVRWADDLLPMRRKRSRSDSKASRKQPNVSRWDSMCASPPPTTSRKPSLGPPVTPKRRSSYGLGSNSITSNSITKMTTAEKSEKQQRSHRRGGLRLQSPISLVSSFFHSSPFDDGEGETETDSSDILDSTLSAVLRVQDDLLELDISDEY